VQQWLKNHSCPVGQQRFLAGPLYPMQKTNMKDQKIKISATMAKLSFLFILLTSLTISSYGQAYSIYHVKFDYYHSMRIPNHHVSVEFQRFGDSISVHVVSEPMKGQDIKWDETKIDSTLPINYHVTNQNDKQAMTAMVKEAIDIVGNNTFDAVFDKGYYTAEQIYDTQQTGVTTHVCIPNPASTAPDPAYNVSEFTYNKERDQYTRPASQTLKSNGTWYDKGVYREKQYKTKNCKNCPVKNRCTKAKYQRIIERHEFAEALEKNKENNTQNPEIYAQRQSIVEHPFGTMKRQWGFDHILTKKTMKRASSDVGFIFIAYNLRRIFNIIGIEKLMDRIADCGSKMTKKGSLRQLELVFNDLGFIKSTLPMYRVMLNIFIPLPIFTKKIRPTMDF
jgi:hypothetical protein